MSSRGHAGPSGETFPWDGPGLPASSAGGNGRPQENRRTSRIPIERAKDLATAQVPFADRRAHVPLFLQEIGECLFADIDPVRVDYHPIQAVPLLIAAGEDRGLRRRADVQVA